VLGVLFFDSQCICLSVSQLHTPIGKTVLFSARFTTEHQLETPWKSNPLMSVAIRPQEMAETFIATGTILSCSRAVFHFLLNQPSKVSFWPGSLKRADLGWGTNWKQCTTTISCITQVRHFEGLSRNGFKLSKVELEHLLGSVRALWRAWKHASLLQYRPTYKCNPGTSQSNDMSWEQGRVRRRCPVLDGGPDTGTPTGMGNFMRVSLGIKSR